MATQTGSISFESQGGFQSYASGQYATLAQVKGQFATCSTAAGTQAKAATIVPTDSGWALYTGATITVKFTTANTHATPTLNVNSTGAKSIRDHTGAALTEDAYNWAAGTAMSFTYDGTYWRLQDTLPQRVTTAETAIVENAGKIELRATKTEAYQLSQPNLTPYYSMPKADTRSANPTSGYWVATYQTNATMITTWDFQQAGPDGAGGWAHLVANNTGSSTVYAPSYIHKDGLSLKPSTTYTILAEWAGVTVSGGVGISPTTQHGGTNGANDDFFTTSTSVTLTSGSGSYAFVVTTRAALESGCNNRIRSHVSISAGASFDGYVRLSIYEGEYTGPYKPYVGPTLYASQAELKVANDEISSKVSKDGVISSINQSAESVTINASKVNVAGVITAINNDTTTTIDGGKITAHTITADSLAIGAVDVGGRNLSKVVGSSSTPTEYLAAYYYISEALEAEQSYVLQLWNVDVSHTGKTADTLGVGVYYCGGTVNLGGWLGTDYFTNGHADHLTLVFTPHLSGPATTSGGNVSSNQNLSHSSVTNNASNPYIRLYNSPQTADGTRNLTVDRIKLERGNKATDWTPAPEDVDTDISDAAKTASNYISADSTGIRIASANPATQYQRLQLTNSAAEFYDSNNKKRTGITASGMDVYDSDGTTSVANFGTTARIGKAASGHVLITPDTLSMRHYNDRLVEVKATGQLTSMYVGGSTAAAGKSYTDAYVEMLCGFLNDGCTVTSNVIYDSSGADTGLTLSTGSPKYVLDSAGAVIKSGAYEGIFFYNSSTFSLDIIMSPASELPGTPVHAEISRAVIDIEDGAIAVVGDDKAVIKVGSGSDAACMSLYNDGTHHNASLSASSTTGVTFYAGGTANVGFADMEMRNAENQDTIDIHLHGDGNDPNQTSITLDASSQLTRITPSSIAIDPGGITSTEIESGTISAVNDTEEITIGTTSGVRGMKVEYASTGGSSVSFGVGSAGSNHGVYSNTQSKWLVHGDGNSVFLGGVRFESGSVGQNISAAANSVTTYPSASNSYVTFSQAFSSTPVVVVGFYSTSTAAGFGGLSIATSEVTASGFKVKIFNNTSSSRSPGFYWIAVGA